MEHLKCRCNALITLEPLEPYTALGMFLVLLLLGCPLITPSTIFILKYSCNLLLVVVPHEPSTFKILYDGLLGLLGFEGFEGFELPPSRLNAFANPIA